MRLRLLDLFCGAGGAGYGYHKAGFDVVGVDLAPQPNYPFQFVQADATNFDLDEFDAVHASPPCQGYSHAVTSDKSQYVYYSQGKSTPRLIHVMRDRFKAAGIPYVIENVLGARGEMENPIMLCGVMFGLPIARHRYFESSVPLSAPVHGKCSGVAKKYAIENGIDYRDMSVTGKSRRKGCIETWKKLMCMPWAGRGSELAEAIPPVYTEYIGKQLFQHICAENIPAYLTNQSDVVNLHIWKS
jgi:hypothetical protein